MLADKPRDQRATFPITARATQLRKAWYILLSPITWIPTIFLLFTAFCLDFSLAVTCATFLVTNFGIVCYWISKNKRLEQTVIRELITESNVEQNRRLHEQATMLFDRGFNYYGSMIISFITLKKSIEGALHTDKTLSEKKQEIENLVDTIVFGASDQVTRLVNLENQLGPNTPFSIANTHRKKVAQARHELSNQLEEAFTTLTTTNDKLAMIINPAHQIDTSKPTKPDCLVKSAINNLNEEQQLVERIRERLELEES